MTERRQWSRRRWLATAGSAAGLALAGCSSDGGAGTDDGSTATGTDDSSGTTNSGDENAQSFEGPVTAEGEWPMRHFDATNNRVTEAVSGPPVAVQERWSERIGEIVTSPVVAGDTVYVATLANDCYAFDLLTGSQRWKRSFTKGIYSLAADENRVYVGGKDGLSAITHDNELDWEVDEIGYGMGVNKSDGTVYVTDQRALYAREAESGAKVWTTQVENAVTLPAIAGGSVLTKDPTYFRGFDAETGDQRFQVEHAGTIANTLVTVADGTAYFMADTNIEARSIDDGSLEWNWTDGAAEEVVPAVADGVVYAKPHGKGGPYRIDADTGESLDNMGIDGFTGPPTVADGTVFFWMLPDLRARSRLYAVDADSLSVTWQTTVPARSAIAHGPIVLEDVIAYATEKSVHVVAPA